MPLSHKHAKIRGGAGIPFQFLNQNLNQLNFTKHGYWVPNKKEVVYKDVYDKDWNKIRNHIDYYYVLEWNPLPNDPLRQEDKEIYKYTVYTE